MSDEPDILLAAGAMIDLHGESAAAYVAGRAAQYLVDGDPRARRWLAILLRIEHLRLPQA